VLQETGVVIMLTQGSVRLQKTNAHTDCQLNIIKKPPCDAQLLEALHNGAFQLCEAIVRPHEPMNANTGARQECKRRSLIILEKTHTRMEKIFPCMRLILKRCMFNYAILFASDSHLVL
jgi:hypothetical protein